MLLDYWPAAQPPQLRGHAVRFLDPFNLPVAEPGQGRIHIVVGVSGTGVILAAGSLPTSVTTTGAASVSAHGEAPVALAFSSAASVTARSTASVRLAAMGAGCDPDDDDLFL